MTYSEFTDWLEENMGTDGDEGSEDLDDIVQTRDTFGDFARRWGNPSHTTCGVSIWRGIQPNGKGTPRGDLSLADSGEFRYAYFA